MENCPGEGVVTKFPNSRKHSHRQVCGEFRNLRRQHNWEKTKQTNKNKEDTPNHNCQWRTTSEWGLDREAWAASSILRVRTGPECLEDNLRELT